MELTACLISLKVVGFVSRILARLVLMKMGIGILLDPISKSPGDKAEIPVSINFVDMANLVVVKVESVFKFLETVFNTPPEQVVCNDHFGRGTEIVGNKDMILVVVILIPLAKYDYKLDGDITILQFCLERIGFM